jgi:hypothetical protein
MNETNDRTVHLHNINGETLATIIDYAYSKRIDLTDDNIFDILAAANQFEYLELINTCEHFLIEKLTSTNVLGIRDFASFFCKSNGASLLENMASIAPFVRLPETCRRGTFLSAV